MIKIRVYFYFTVVTSLALHLAGCGLSFEPVPVPAPTTTPHQADEPEETRGGVGPEVVDAEAVADFFGDAAVLGWPTRKT